MALRTAKAPVNPDGHMTLMDHIGELRTRVVRSAIAIAVCAVVAWFLRWVRRHGFAPFAIYRIALGLGLLVALGRGLIGR